MRRNGLGGRFWSKGALRNGLESLPRLEEIAWAMRRDRQTRQSARKEI